LFSTKALHSTADPDCFECPKMPNIEIPLKIPLEKRLILVGRFITMTNHEKLIYWTGEIGINCDV